MINRWLMRRPVQHKFKLLTHLTHADKIPHLVATTDFVAETTAQARMLAREFRRKAELTNKQRASVYLQLKRVSNDGVETLIAF